MENNLVKSGERVDDLQNGYFVIQDPKNSVLVWMPYYYPDLQR